MTRDGEKWGGMAKQKMDEVIRRRKQILFATSSKKWMSWYRIHKEREKKANEA